MTSVYKLEGMYDDPRYEGFAYNEFKDDPFVVKLPQGGWQPPVLAGRWTPTGVKGRVQPYNDFPCLMTDPAFSRRAVDSLGSILAANGELIPFESPVGEYFAYNITTVVDALDLEKSRVIYFSQNAIKVLQILHYDFFPDMLVGQTIFRIRERPRDAYVTDSFVDRVRDRGLQGFAFYKVWPLDPAVDWRSVASEEKKRLAAMPLPERFR